MRKFLLVLGLIALMSGVVLADNYAVIIQGSSPSKGMLPEGVEPTYSEKWFMDEFWQDPLLVYLALRNAGIPEENMYVLWGDGSQWGCEQADYQPRYRIPYVDMDASYESVEFATSDLAERMTENDVLFVYTFDHGGPNSLCLYGGSISDVEFAELFDQIPYKYRWIGMQQCFSGSFIDALENEKTLMVTSTDDAHSAYRADNVLVPGGEVIPGSENEIYQGKTYNHGEWNTHLLTGFWGGQMPSAWWPDPIYRDSIDTDANGKISVAEIQVWIDSRDSRPEFPQLSDPGNLAARFYVWPEIAVAESGIEENPIPAKQLVRVYPNPSDGQVKFITSIVKPLTYSIYDASGRLVIKTNQPEAKINSSGIYFWRALKDDKEIQQGKLIVLK